jgi:mono/diheme cytochrome c family protein
MSRCSYKIDLLTLCLSGVLVFTCTKVLAGESKQGSVVYPHEYKPAPVSSASRAGEKLVEKHNCLMCHSIANKGGCLSPPFDGIGAYRTRQFILARISRGAVAEAEFQKLYGGKAELMPHLRVPTEEAKLVAQYLLTLPAPPGGFYIGSHEATIHGNLKSTEEKKNTDQIDEKKISVGRKLFYERGCTACHSIGNIGGHFAPHLDAIGKRRSRSYIEQRITNAELLSQNSGDEYAGRGAVMPPSGLSSDEISSITDFLSSLH